MHSLSTLSLLFTLVSLSLFPSLALTLEKPSIHDVLRSNGLPIGLFPHNLSNFEIDSHGNFTIHLDRPCDAKFENEIHYDVNVFGMIGYGRMIEMKGIEAKDLFLWLPVREIRVDVPSSGVIYFDVGVVLKQFPISLFEIPPDCVADLKSGERDSVDLKEKVAGGDLGENIVDLLEKIEGRDHRRSWNQ